MPNATVLSSFTITAKTRSFQLDTQGKGVCNFIIANSGKAALEGRVRLTPTGQNPAVAEWLTITEPAEQAYKPNEERTYSVNIIVPADAPGGTYLFRAEAYSVANPNDDYIGGPEFSFTVMRAAPNQPSKGFPLWIPFTALALVVAIAALVAVFVMSGNSVERVTVPDLAGKTQDEAGTLLSNAHLALGPTEFVPTAEIQEGLIISQAPLAGETADSGSTVSLQLAAKPETPMAPVPALVGKTLDEARKLLAVAKLKPGLVGEKDEGTGLPGTVLEQLPAAGASVGEGSEISLMVKAQPAPAGPPTPQWQGTMSVRQTWFGDIDSGKECDNATRKDADFWFRAETATERFLDAQNGAAFGFPSEPTLASCSEAIKIAPVTRIALASLKPEKLIAVRTNLGRYVLVSLAQVVGPSPATLDLRYQRFLIRVLPIRPVLDIKAIREIKVMPVKPLSITPVQPARPMVMPAEPVRPITGTAVRPVLVKTADEPAEPKEEKRVIRKDLLIR